jgi:hypothetical protein
MHRPQVYYHAVDCCPAWLNITTEQLDKIVSSGLINNCDLHINCHYDYNNWQQLKNKYQYANIVWYNSSASPAEFEHPTYILMQNHALENPTRDYYALYLHQKGITHVGTAKDTTSTHWRWYLDYFNIERWKDCINILDTGLYDTCGVQRSRQPEWPDFLPDFYEGNVCWYTSSFLRRATPLVLPSQANFKAQYGIPHDMYRSDVELWAWHNKDRWYSFHHSGLNHYCSEYPPESYR